MGMSDCEKCWDTPCTCGHDYRDWTKGQLRSQIAMLKRVLAKKTMDKKIKRTKAHDEAHDRRMRKPKPFSWT
jgi:hypothetical protein